MNGEASHRLRELTGILSELSVPHPPLERFKLGSRLWRLLAGLSRNEQKQLLREFGLQEALHLNQLAKGSTGVMPATFLQFIERGTKTLTPERISAVLGALAAVAGQEADPTVPPPPVVPDQLDEHDVQTPEEVPDVVRSATAAPVTLTPEAEGDEGKPRAPVDDDEPVADIEPAAFPSPTDRSTPSQPSRQADVGPEEVAATTEDEIEEELPASESVVDPSPPSTSSRVDLLTERCAGLDSPWKRRRFWLDVVRRGFERDDADAILRAVSESSLPPQDYVWVVDEMVVRALLPAELFPTAIELAPSEPSARLLQRRLLTLSRAWAGEFHTEANDPEAAIREAAPRRRGK